MNSASLEASGSDAMFDSIISASVLLCALIYIAFGLSLEAYAGVIISIVIIRSGVEMLRDTLDDILGKRYDSEELQAIKNTMNLYDNAKTKQDLVEVIIAACDGKIYFLDMDTGEQTELALDESFAEKFSVLNLTDHSSFSI